MRWGCTMNLRFLATSLVLFGFSGTGKISSIVSRTLLCLSSLCQSSLDGSCFFFGSQFLGFFCLSRSGGLFFGSLSLFCFLFLLFLFVFGISITCLSLLLLLGCCSSLLLISSHSNKKSFQFGILLSFLLLFRQFFLWFFIYTILC